ncbi:DUF1028 domain-containing protein [Natribaculum luteum]|uniref:DUF1028 domain-containing protein n=1 Tax=Natribaculum luteum TaxID=1586232 RepID=A0ABD5P5N2_9EURY|nr:DUF1028 domain-containing protein [Natribaculum luteum]
MTFSICVREEYEDDAGESQRRFGVAVTTRLAGVGTLCPFASENGAIATQSLVNVDLGRRGIRYVDEGLAVEDAVQSLLNADEGAPSRQVHGVDADGSFTFSGEECRGWYGHLEGDGYTVAGNLLTGESVIEATAASYEASDRDEPLAKRLIDALEAGDAEGGDKREELSVQSAAVVVRTTEERDLEPPYDDLRVDATETPIADLRETYELARQGHEDAMARYEDAYDEDDLESVEE